MLIKFISLCFMCLATQASSSDDRFIKKYAMMKIYESCFGPEVVKQIRKEMKEAYAKCSAPSFDEPPNQQNIPPILLAKLPPGFALDPASQTIVKPADGAGHQEESAQDQGNQQHKVGQMPNILPFRPQPAPFPQQNPYALPGGQFRPYSPFYQPQPQMPQVPQAYNPLFYPPQYNPYYQYPQFYQQPYFPSSRMSRDLDFRDRLDMISRGPTPRARNVTCVMQELGYIDHNLEPNYEQITQRISALPVSAELKGDIQDGLQFCEKFSQCVPDLKRDVAPLSQELIKPMFFFRCYKHKKLEACIMKDIRERFTSEDDLETEGDFRSLSRSARAARDEPLNDPRFDALDEMSVYLYDYLSGGNGLDFDLYL